jgi:hypothetical protein
MVLHIYHAEVAGKAFDTELDIPDPDDATSFTFALRAHIDETHEAIFDHVKKGLRCDSCGVRDATTFIHHPMLFSHADPPRVEDILSPVCGRADCSRHAKDEIEMALARSEVFSGLSPKVGQVLVGCENCVKQETPGDKLLQCSRCKWAKYCSTTCQRAHWPKHKSVCKPNE